MNLNNVQVLVCKSQEKFSLFYFQLAEQRKTMIEEMAANRLQVEEKTKLDYKNLKEKYQTDIERIEKENNELKVKIYIRKFYFCLTNIIQIKDRTLKQYQSRCIELENRIKSDEELKQTLTNHLEQLKVYIYIYPGFFFIPL